MDRISYECAGKLNDNLAWIYQFVCKRNLKVWRYPVSGSGGHYCDPYIDDLHYDDEPEDDYDDTIVAPNWDELRQILNHFEPPLGILVEFEAIDNIDEYATKLVDYMKENPRGHYFK